MSAGVLFGGSSSVLVGACLFDVLVMPLFFWMAMVMDFAHFSLVSLFACSPSFNPSQWYL